MFAAGAKAFVVKCLRLENIFDSNATHFTSDPSQLMAKLGQNTRINHFQPASNSPFDLGLLHDLPNCLRETSLNDINWNCKVLTGLNRELPHRGLLQLKSSCSLELIWSSERTFFMGTVVMDTA